jgi:nucleoside-diphosphate-sugar epimerase
VISRFISALLSGESPVIFGDGEQSRDFTYVANVVEANLRAAETKEGIGQVINIGNGERTTLNELLSQLKILTARTEIAVEHLPTRAGDVRDSLADIARAREFLGFEPRIGLREGLQLTIDWWKRSHS